MFRIKTFFRLNQRRHMHTALGDRLTMASCACVRKSSIVKQHAVDHAYRRSPSCSHPRGAGASQQPTCSCFSHLVQQRPTCSSLFHQTARTAIRTSQLVATIGTPRTAAAGFAASRSCGRERPQATLSCNRACVTSRATYTLTGMQDESVLGTMNRASTTLQSGPNCGTTRRLTAQY